MQTERFTRTVVTKYEAWKCHNPEHGHRDQKRAQACIDLHESGVIKRSSADVHAARKRRNKEALRLYLTGMNYKEIGARMNVKQETIGCNLRDVKWRVERWLKEQAGRGTTDISGVEMPYGFTAETLRAFYLRNKRHFDFNLSRSFIYNDQTGWERVFFPPPPFFNDL